MLNKKLGHFGLALEVYTHFTSPIRRYPDLMCHRVIKARLENRTPIIDEIDILLELVSRLERRGDMAMRDALTWCKCIYMRDKIGKTFVGKISSVREFGIFVFLEECNVDGLIHISNLGNDYFIFNEDLCTIRGETSNESFVLGDEIIIKVSKVSIEKNQIDFVLV